MTAPTLSKSKYLAGCQCELRAWLTCRAPELATPPDTEKQAIFDLGHLIGRRAHALFPGGVLVSQQAWEHAPAVARTRALLADPAVPAIFEAAFEFAGVRIRADVLERLPGGGFGLREVKASTSVKPEHLDDCAVQLHVLEGCGLRIASVELVHVNRDYVRDAGPIDWQAFFARVDLTREVAAGLPGVRERLPRLHAAVRSSSAPEIEPSGHCFAPHDCEFWDHCTRNKPGDWIFHLPRIGSRFEVLRSAGIERIVDIPNEFSLPDAQARIREALRNGKLKIEPGLGRTLREAEPPAHYLDFETTNPALPVWVGTRPYEIIPFQWSLHTLDETGRLHHREFLADGAADPRREFAETLVATLGDDERPVLVYSSFESARLRRLAELQPDLAPGLGRIRNRLFDLLPIVRNYIYHPDFGCSFSIKAVAPALAPGLDWSDLDAIAEGGAASRAFAGLAAGQVPAVEREPLRAALRSYCARDTLALARVHEALREMAF